MFLILSTPLALGPFTSGWMLLWGLAALVPILLHFLNRRRQRTVSWAAMQFLAEAIRSQARRMRLWQLLLLLLRILAIVLITLAVANPIFRGADDVQPGTSEANLHVFVIDTTYSMRAAVDEGEVDGQRRWELAQEAAIAKLKTIPSGDGLLLVEMSDPPRPVVARMTFDAGLIQRSVYQMEPTYESADVEATLSLVEALIADAQRIDQVHGEIEVTFFSDMQRPTWQTIARRESTRRWQPLGPAVLVDLIDVTDAAGANVPEERHINLAVSELKANPPLVFADQPALIEATLFASGDLPDTEQRVQLKIDGKLRDSQAILFGASDQATVSFKTAFTPGEKVVTVEIGTDILPIDNQRSLVLNVPQSLRVLCLGPRHRTRYIAAAIKPGEQAWVEVIEVPAAGLASVEDESFDVVMLCDIESPNSRLIRWLDRSASQGAGILWWIGGAADADAYSALRDPDLAELLPVRLDAPTDFDAYPVDPRSYEHPIAATFKDFPQSGLLSTPIFRYWRVGMREQTESESRVALGVGPESDPLLLTFHAPEHRVAIFNSAPAAAGGSGAADTEEPWNALVAWPSFVPLVQETVRWLAASRFERPTYRVGNALGGTVESEQTAVQRIRQVDGEDMPVTVRQQTDGRWRWSTPSLTQPGIYQLFFADDEVQSVAVNLDPTECDLEKVVGLTARQSLEDRVSSSAATRTGRSTELQASLFRWLLLVALATLLAESLFSRTMAGWKR